MKDSRFTEERIIVILRQQEQTKFPRASPVSVQKTPTNHPGAKETREARGKAS
jgi:hypothetical protein